MWKAEHRVACDRRGHRYPSDLSDAEWALIAPFVPPARHGGRKRHVNMREVLNGIFYVLSTGCQWSALPKDLPPKSTVHDYFILLDRTGALARMHEALYVAVREAAGREASPTAAIIDSQSARAAPKGALHSIRRASTPARKSRAASAMCSSTPSAFC
jgi:transposase